jgi:hypothetical protein
MRMTSSLFLRIKPLNIKTMRGVTSNASVIRVAAMHNLREIVAEFGARADSHINPARIALNYQLRGPGTAAGVADLAQALLDNAGVQKLRRDACMALELVFSLPQGSAVDHREYFAAAVAWADGFFNVPILSAAVHLDEPAKHCHVLLLPLVAGRMQGGALAGGPAKIRMMLADFQQQVGQRFGLAHQPRAKRLSKSNRDAAGRMVLDMLKAHPERLNVPAVRDALVAALGQHHETLLPLLDLALPAPAKAKGKSFAAIMTAPCKPERPAGKRTSIHVAEPKSIDVGPATATNAVQESSNVYLCVHVAPPAPAFPPTTSTQPAGDPRINRTANSEASQPEAGAQWSAAQRSTTSSDPAPAPRTRSTSTTTAPSPASTTNDETQQMHAIPAAQEQVKAGKSGNAPATDQPDGIRLLGQAMLTSASITTAPQAAPAHAAGPTHHQPGNDRNPSSFGRIEPAPRAAGIDMEPPTTSIDDFQRQRDDDRPADEWNADTGEFVTTASAPARPPGRHGRAPYTARASPDDSQHPAPTTIHRSRTESYP